MNAAGLSKRWLRRSRQVVAPLCAAWFAITVLGVPMPGRVVGSNSDSRPFICQGHNCGCPSAEACWDHCCCYSHEEKLAWAMQQGITPPPEVMAKMLADRQAKDQTKQVAKHRECHNCCDKHDKHCSSTEPQADAAQTTGGGLISFIQQQRCRGLQPWWYALGAAVEPPAIVAALSDEAVAIHSAILSPAWESFSTPPPVPPPRCA